MIESQGVAESQKNKQKKGIARNTILMDMKTAPAPSKGW